MLTHTDPQTDRLGRRCAGEPAALAFESGGAALSFAEFEARVAACAAGLAAAGVGPGALVAVALARSLALPVVLHAIVRCGGAYLPVDTRWPARRVESILADSRAGHVVYDRGHAALGALAAVRGATARGLADGLTVARGAAELAPELPPRLAYAIYTSGSSGRPKGVAMSHGPALRTLDWVNANCAVGPADCLLATASAAFDLSVYDLFGPCAAGGSVLLASDEQLAHPEQLAALLAANRATLWNSAPSVLDQVLECAGAERTVSEAMRVVMLSGDWIPLSLPARIRRAFPNAALLAMGGATEAAIWSNYHWVERVDPAWKSIPYGRPYEHAAYYVLDEQRRPCAPDQEGDLFIGGDCLADGYLHAPALTAEKFVRDPFAPGADARMYATGDRARYWPDGTIEFLGRRDEQVKVLGYRVDLVEIERAASAHPAVQQAVVVAADRNSPAAALVGFVIPDREQAAPLRRLLALERRGAVAAHELCELDDGTSVASTNPGETRFLHRELFVEDCYGLRAAGSNYATVVDVGANVGLFALAVARLHPQARIVGVEPVPELARLARLNAELHGVPLRVVEAALDATAGQTDLQYYPHLSLLSRFETDAAADAALIRTYVNKEHGAGLAALSATDVAELIARTLTLNRVSASRLTLSQVYADEGLAEVDLLKINVHGSEARILAGLSDADLARTRRIVVETHDGAARAAIVARLERHGFACAVTPHDCLAAADVHIVTASAPGAAGGGALAARAAVPLSGRRGLSRALEAALAGDLPPHMIPRRWFFLETLPVTPNGKVDRKALERLALERRDDAPAGPAVPDAAASPTAQAIAEVWREVLGSAAFGLDDSFFQLGGDSLKITQVVARLRRRLPVEIPLRRAFEFVTIRELAAAIDRHNAA